MRLAASKHLSPPPPRAFPSTLQTPTLAAAFGLALLTIQPRPAHSAGKRFQTASTARSEPSVASAAVEPAGASAEATEPSGPRPLRWSGAVLLGGSTGGYGLGMGGRVGATLADHIYVGGTAFFHLGRFNSNAYASSEFHAFQLGGEVGYALLVPPVIIRPYAGLGLLTGFGSVTTGNNTVSNSYSTLGLWFGGTVAYRIANSPFSVGGDLRILAPLEGTASLGLFAMGSMTF
jgi:hypothetical protein